jgi:hypothetical protein
MQVWLWGFDTPGLERHLGRKWPWSKWVCHASGHSPGRTDRLDRSPWRRAFWEDLALPAAVLGPVEWEALARLDAVCTSEVMVSAPKWNLEDRPGLQGSSCSSLGYGV